MKERSTQRRGVNIPQFALSLILAIAVASVLIMVSIGVVYTFSSSMPSVTGVANMTGQPFVNVFASAYSGLDLFTILPVVLAAALIIFLIVGSFMCLRASGACE